MPKTISPETITLYNLEQRFGIEQIEDAQFFPAWRENLPVLAEEEQQRLERVKAIYANLARRSVLENTVKMAIISPLLDLAGFYLPPFYVNTEEEVHLLAEDEGLPIRGRIEVLNDQFWVSVIESKRAEFSLKVGIPQALTYMLATPNRDRPLYGMVTNGSNFVFPKLVQQDKPYYARSKMLDLEESNELHTASAGIKAVGRHHYNRRIQ